ncbi:MAG: MIP/aquaporin family protein [Sphingobacteriales bacterium]|jgi:glycerol uptake facilitator protein
MNPVLGEFIGTILLITLGTGVNINVSLKKTYGNNSGWIIITLGWAMAVFVGVIFSAPISGAHLNPAVTLALAIAGSFEWSNVPGYFLAQVAGASVGSALAWLAYRKHFEEPGQEGGFLGVFATGPAIKDSFHNFLTECMATFVFMVAVFSITKPETGIGSIDALPVSFIVLAIGLCLGGSTGYAINPARDLGPRITHAVLPISGKGSSNWQYAWIPILGPMLGAALAALLFMR